MEEIVGKTGNLFESCSGATVAKACFANAKRRKSGSLSPRRPYILLRFLPDQPLRDNAFQYKE